MGTGRVNPPPSDFGGCEARVRREAAQLPPPGFGSPRAGGPDLGLYVTGADSGPAGRPKRSLRRGASKSLEIKVKKPFLLLSNYSVWVGERRVEVGAVGGKPKFLLADTRSLENTLIPFLSCAFLPIMCTLTHPL